MKTLRTIFILPFIIFVIFFTISAEIFEKLSEFSYKLTDSCDEIGTKIGNHFTKKINNKYISTHEVDNETKEYYKNKGLL